ncbi:hypothetical protein CL634_00045 [bacterium]|nr:hypothetical protein [bacterium]
MADVAKNIISTDAGERNGTIMVGAPKAAGTAIYGTNYRIRAGGEAATATVTFAGVPAADQTVVIIDAKGISKTYTAKTSETAASLFFNQSGTAAAAATSLKACMDHANGHNGSVAVADDGAGVLTLTQLYSGTIGHTTITENCDNVTKTDFSGGTVESGINDAYDVGGLETKYTGRFDDRNYDGLAT